jgi:GNAT superfamily N-acetyltransferase
MKLRPYCDNDIAEIVSLLNEANGSSYEFIPGTEEGVRARLTGASSVLLATDEQHRVLGLAYLRQDWYGETITLAVRAGLVKDDIASLLLAAIEPQNKTGDVSTSVDSSDSERFSFFATRGYQPESTLYQLLAELEELPPVPAPPSDYIIRSLRADEEEALIRLANTAYDGERLRPGILARWSADDPVFDLDLVAVAEHKCELVALVAGRSDRDYNQYYHAHRGYLGPAGTLPEHRGKGLGKILTARAMQVLRERGMQAVCLHTWGGNRPALNLTRDLGFRVGHEYRILHKTVSRSGKST